jgi:hypothetical protein
MNGKSMQWPQQVALAERAQSPSLAHARRASGASATTTLGIGGGSNEITGPVADAGGKGLAGADADAVATALGAALAMGNGAPRPSAPQADSVPRAHSETAIRPSMVPMIAERAVAVDSQREADRPTGVPKGEDHF